MCSAFIPQVGLAAFRGPILFYSILSSAKLIAVFTSLSIRSPKIDSGVDLTLSGRGTFLDCLPCLLDFPFGSSSPRSNRENPVTRAGAPHHRTGKSCRTNGHHTANKINTSLRYTVLHEFSIADEPLSIHVCIAANKKYSDIRIMLPCTLT